MEKNNYCPSCGIENKTNAKFCEGCGMQVGKQEISSELKSSEKGQEAQEKYDTQVMIKYASDGDRLVALILDGILFSAITGLIGLIFGQSWWFGLGISGNFWKDSWPSMIAGLTYFILMENFNHGQTLGKLAMKIQTVNESTLQPVSIREAILHSIGTG